MTPKVSLFVALARHTLAPYCVRLNNVRELSILAGPGCELSMAQIDYGGKSGVRKSSLSGRFTERSIQQLIQEIQISAFDPSRWPDTIIKISEPIDCHCAHLINAGSTGLVSYLKLREGLPSADDEADLLEDINAGNNPKVNFTRTTSRTGYWSDWDILTEEEMSVHPHYHHPLIKKYHAHYSGGLIIENREHSMIALGSFRRKSAGRFQSDEQHYFRLLAPYLESALAIGRSIHVDTLLESRIDHLLGCTRAVYLLSARGEVLESNQHGLTLLASVNSLYLEGRRLIMADAHCNQQLQKDIQREVIGDRHLPAVGKAGNITFVENGRRYRLYIGALRSELDKLYGFSGVVVVESEALPERRSLERALSEEWQLTPAEIQLVVALYRGASVKEYAKHQGLSEATPRSHLKNIFSKLEVRRQGELIAKLHHLPRRS